MPHGLGKSKKVLVIASGEKVREAEAAGADFVGGEDMVEKITKENWTDFDALIATPDMMKSVGRLGKVLGPKGLMPNPKTGTVTMDVAQGGAGSEGRQGRIPHRQDGAGACAGGQDFIHARQADRQRNHGDLERDQGEACGRQGQVHQGLLPEFEHGSWDFAGYDSDRGCGEGIETVVRRLGVNRSVKLVARATIRTTGDQRHNDYLKGFRTWRLPEQRKLRRLRSSAANLKNVSSVIVATYSKLTVAQDFELRKALRRTGAKYRVVKNTLAERAGKGTKIEAALKNFRA